MRKILLLFIAITAAIVFSGMSIHRLYVAKDFPQENEYFPKPEKEQEEKWEAYYEQKVFSPEPLIVEREEREERKEAVLTGEGIIEWTNNHRAEHNLISLTENETLNEIAKNKVEDMFKLQYFAHTSPQGKEVGDIATAKGDEFIMVGENLAMGGFEDDKDLLQGWMDSPGHRENILTAAYHEMGVAVEKDYFEGKKIWMAVQIFGTPASACPGPEEKLIGDIKAVERDIETLTDKMESAKKELEEINKEKREEYNRKAGEYNRIVEEYNLMVDLFRKLVDQYNTEIKEREQCIEDLGERKNSVSSSPERAPATSVNSLSYKDSEYFINCLYDISGIPSPKGAAFSPDGKEIWITSLMNKARGVVVLEADTGEHKQNIVLPDGGGVEVIFNNEGDRAFVSQMESARVFEIDTKSKEILRTFDTKSAWTKVLALSPEEDLLYASNWSGNDVSVIDLSTGKTLYRIPTVSTPRGIYATDNYLYVAGFQNGEIEKINLETREGEVLYTTGGAMRHIVADKRESVLYFSDMGTASIYKVDMETGKVEKFADTETNPNTIALTPDSKILAVSNRGRNNPQSYHVPGPEWGSILFFDTTTGKMLDVLVGGNQPTALDITSNGKYLAYSNFLDGELKICRLPSYKDLLKAEGGRSDTYRDKLEK